MKHKLFFFAILFVFIFLISMISNNKIHAQGEFVVDEYADSVDENPGDGVCGTTGNCFLRAAIQEANALPGHNTIRLPAGIFQLTIPGAYEHAGATGDLNITDDVTIVGEGAESTIIDGGALDKVIKIHSGIVVHISDLTIRNGRFVQSYISDGEAGGIAIGHKSELTLENCIIRDNEGTGLEVGVDSTLVIDNCLIEDNFAVDAGGIFNRNGVVILRNSIVRDNYAMMATDPPIRSQTGYGGGIENIWGTIVIENSTIAGNGAAHVGGGIYNTGILTMTNSTISGNFGEGIYNAHTNSNFSTVADLNNVSIAHNFTGVDAESDTTIRLGNSILAGNSASGNSDCRGVIESLGHNLIQNLAYCEVVGNSTGNIYGEDPKIADLGFYGGSTPTHALLPDSPAIDAGNPITPGIWPTACEAKDQRGYLRLRGAACDIGAYEFESPDQPNDLEAYALEVTQVIQNLDNDVRLVADKPTMVRLHVRSISGINALTNARLRVQNDSRTDWIDPNSPYILVRSDPDRGIYHHTYNFILPSNYTKAGCISLEGVVDPNNQVSDNNRGNNRIPNNKPICFETVPIPKLILYRVGFGILDIIPEGKIPRDVFPPLADAERMVDYVENLFPISNLDARILSYRHSELDEYERAVSDDINNRLEMIRLKDLNSRRAGSRNEVSSYTRYYGMFDEDASHQKIFSFGAEGGKAQDIPSHIASGVTGSPSNYRTRFYWDKDFTYGDIVGAHELGHTYGRRHLLCNGEGGPDTNPDAPPGGRISTDLTGNKAFYGINVATKEIFGPEWTDIMTYCDFEWISAYTYENLMDYFINDLIPPSLKSQQVDSVDRLLIVGTLNPAMRRASLQPIFILPGADDIEPRIPGDYSIVLRDSNLVELARYPFTPDEPTEVTSSLSFSELVPYIEGTTQVDLEGPGNSVLTTINAGPIAPEVNITQPNSGGLISGSRTTVAWTASDPDDENLYYIVDYSPDNGNSWFTVASNITSTEISVDTSSLPQGKEALFRVWASDGINTSRDTTDFPFIIPNHLPSVEITTPEDDLTLSTNQTLALTGFAYDVDTGLLEGQWSSNLDGVLGAGRYLSVIGLTPGTHVIDYSVEDDTGITISDSIQVTIVGDISQLPEKENKLIAGPPIDISKPQDNTITRPLFIENNNGANVISWNATSSVPWIELSKDSGFTPDEINISIDAASLPSGIHTATITLTSVEIPNKSEVVPVRVLIDGDGTLIVNACRDNNGDGICSDGEEILTDDGIEACLDDVTNCQPLPASFTDLEARNYKTFLRVIGPDPRFAPSTSTQALYIPPATTVEVSLGLIPLGEITVLACNDQNADGICESDEDLLSNAEACLDEDSRCQALPATFGGLFPGSYTPFLRFTGNGRGYYPTTPKIPITLSIGGEKTIALGMVYPIHPKGVAVHKKLNRVYVAFQGPIVGNEKPYPFVAVIDSETDEVLQTIPGGPEGIGRGPWGVAVSGGYVYVSSFEEGHVSIIDANTNEVIENIKPLGDFQPTTAVVNPVNGWVHFPDYRGGRVFILNGTEIVAEPRIDIGPAGFSPFEMVVADDGRDGYNFVTMRDAVAAQLYKLALLEGTNGELNHPDVRLPDGTTGSPHAIGLWQQPGMSEPRFFTTYADDPRLSPDVFPNPNKLAVYSFPTSNPKDIVQRNVNISIGDYAEVGLTYDTVTGNRMLGAYGGFAYDNTNGDEAACAPAQHTSGGIYAVDFDGNKLSDTLLPALAVGNPPAPATGWKNPFEIAVDRTHNKIYVTDRCWNPDDTVGGGGILILGLADTGGPAPSPTPSPPTTPVPTTTPAPGLTPTPSPEPTTEPTSEPTPNPINLNFNGPSNVALNELFSVDVVAQGVSEPGLYGTQFEINFDPALVSISNLQANASLDFVVVNNVDNGTGKITFVASRQGSVPGLTDNVTLLTFDATAADDSGAATFSFENVKIGDNQAQSFTVIPQNYTLIVGDVATPAPTIEPTSTPTTELTPVPTDEPTPTPTTESTSIPTDEPTPEPTDTSTPVPTSTTEPTPISTDKPTSTPSPEPTPTSTAEPAPTPTHTPTPTSTDAPTNAVVSGQVILAGRAGNDWSGAIVTIDDSGQNATTNVAGNFTIVNVTTGAHTSITADADGYLPAACVSPTITAPEITLLAVTLLSGDVNGDDTVDITDATAVGAGLGQTGLDLAADINRDGDIDIFDIILVSVNFGKTGPQEWVCQ